MSFSKIFPKEINLVDVFFSLIPQPHQGAGVTWNFLLGSMATGVSMSCICNVRGALKSVRT